MLPDDTLIQSDIHHFKPPRAGYYGTTEAFSQGGVALGDVTQDWFVYTWRAYIKPDGVYLNRTDTTEHKLVEHECGYRLHRGRAAVPICLQQARVSTASAA